MHPAINPHTQKQLEDFKRAAGQVLVIAGQEGSGQDYLSEQAAVGILGVDLEGLVKCAGLIKLEKPDGKKDIPIEAVRALLAKLRIKSLDKRVVLIKSADDMNLEGQNALLKALEQPPTDTFFILSVKRPLLPTVMSRAQIVTAKPVSLGQALSHYAKFPPNRVKSAWALSEGAAGLLHQLLTSEQSPQSLAITTAKQFVSASKFDRLVMIDAIAKDRQASLEFLEALAKILKALHHAAIERGADAKAATLLGSRRTVDYCAKVVNANGAVKLALLGLVTNLTV